MLPTKNPVMLISIINTKLRDMYSDIDSLCDDLDVSKEEIDQILATIGCAYDKEANQYKEK